MTGVVCVKCLIKHKSKDSKRKKVFVLMPFKDPYYDYYRFAIEEVCLSHDWECEYVEKTTFKKGEYIICKICEEIQKADLVIADLSEKNENVYYELGLAHALEKDTIIIANKNSDGISEKFQQFLSKWHIHPINYVGIEDLKDFLDGAEGKPFSLTHKEKIVSDEDKRYSVVCLIPDDAPEDEGRIKFSEVFKYGIKKGIKQLEFPGDDLINLDKEEVHNIIKEAQELEDNENGKENKIADLIHNIRKAQYCIIDITDSQKHPEIFYWLGFIHGLGVNRDIDIKDALICIYITRGKLEKLPFDIRAARVIHYKSLEELSFKIPTEIENLEIDKLNELNKEKQEFWHTFNIKNTKFLVGAADICHPGKDDYHIRDKISIQDFKAFNRIIYLLLFLGRKRSPYQYKMKIIGLYDDEFIGKIENDIFTSWKKDKDKNTDRQNWFEQWHNKIQDFSININKTNIERLGFNEPDDKEVKKYIIIASSSVNAAAEKILLSLYRGKDSGYIFRTTRQYKTRSTFWSLIDEYNDKGKRIMEKAGIYIYLSKEKINRLPERERTFLSNRNQQSWKDKYKQIEYKDYGSLVFAVISKHVVATKTVYILLSLNKFFGTDA
jgi:hypothetical protein